jgi:hypothetical protein
VMGWLREGTNSYSAGLLVLAAALVIEAVLVMSLKLPGGAGRTAPMDADLKMPAPAAQ